MNREYVVYIHNGILFHYYKWWHQEFCKQMDGTKKYHPGWGNPDPEGHAWYVLTYKWILTIK